VEAVEDVLNKGDEVDVKVVEVDRERGRIGLRLADDPDIAGKTVEELAGVGTGGSGGGGRPAGGRDRRPSPNGRSGSGSGSGSGERRGGARRREGERGSGRPRHGRDRD